MRDENVRTFRALMARKGEIRLRASGFSMYPYVAPGDVCRFGPPHKPPLIGQVCLVACSSGILYSHRLHRIERGADGDWYLFRGDANRHYDEPVRLERVIGVLADVRRRGTPLSERDRARRLWSWLAVRRPELLRPYAAWKRRVVRP